MVAITTRLAVEAGQPCGGVRLPAEYVAEHTHLAYASTTYGVQDATIPGSHRATEDAVRRLGRSADRSERRSAERGHLAERHLRESAALRQQVLGSATPSAVIARAAGWRSRAEQARHDLAQIEALPVTVAAQLGQYRPSTDHGRTEPGRDTPSL